MSFQEIEARAREAGFPAPIRSGDTAVIVIRFAGDAPANGASPCAPAEPRRKTPDRAAAPRTTLTAEEFTAWVVSNFGHNDGPGRSGPAWQAAADHLNKHLGTNYQRSDVWRWGVTGATSARPVPPKVANFIRS